MNGTFGSVAEYQRGPAGRRAGCPESILSPAVRLGEIRVKQVSGRSAASIQLMWIAIWISPALCSRSGTFTLVNSATIQLRAKALLQKQITGRTSHRYPHQQDKRTTMGLWGSEVRPNVWNIWERR